MPRERERAALALTEGRFWDRAPTERCFPFFPFFKLPPLYLYVTLTRKVTNLCVRGTSNCKLYQSGPLNPTIFNGRAEGLPGSPVSFVTPKSLIQRLERLTQGDRDRVVAIAQPVPVIYSYN